MTRPVMHLFVIRQPCGTLEGMRETVSERLRRAIEQSDMTQYRIAQGSGISPAVLSRFVRGERGLHIETVDALAELLELELRPKQPRSRRN